MANPHVFANGLTPEQETEIDRLKDQIRNDLIPRIVALGDHQSLTLAMVRLEETWHWLEDRKTRSSKGTTFP